MKIGFVSLGCSKNLIDTEMVMGIFEKNKFQIINNVKEAEIIVINTCGFINIAKEESINTILEMSTYKKNAKCKYLIVIGCLVQRYIKELKKELPEVDLFITINEYENFWKQIEKLINKDQKNKIKENMLCENYGLDYFQRVISTGSNTAYLKIAEGCNNRCTYCAIPYIRGKYISRKFEDILAEAKQLAKNGIKEIIIIAQDTTKYGMDLYGKTRLVELLENLCKIDEFKWIRLLYTYPESITDELINTIKKNDKICKYFDIPIQHISDKVLKRMNRKSTSKQIKELIKKIRKEIPNVIIRTSLIVGFPGETEKDFEELYDFVIQTKFDKIGVFKYSKEENTPAEKLKGQIKENIKEKRYNKIMKLAQKISKEQLKKHIGNNYEILIEGITIDKKYYIGRSYMDIPETDGIVVIENKNKQIEGFVLCKIINTKDYDLVAEIKKLKEI